MFTGGTIWILTHGQMKTTLWKGKFEVGVPISEGYSFVGLAEPSPFFGPRDEGIDFSARQLSYRSNCHCLQARQMEAALWTPNQFGGHFWGSKGNITNTNQQDPPPKERTPAYVPLRVV